MLDVCDDQTSAIFHGDSYIAWLYAIPQLGDAHEVHFIPTDSQCPIYIVRHCTCKMALSFIQFLDAMVQDHTSIIRAHRTIPQMVGYKTNDDTQWILCLSPMSDDLYVNLYPEYHVQHLIWSDQNDHFPWDDNWAYGDLVQPYLPEEMTTLH